MTAFNVVRFKVKQGREAEFVDWHRNANVRMGGLRKAALIKTGDRTYCFIGEWNTFDDIVAGRTAMLGNLERFRDLLEDLGAPFGVTDPVSGEAVWEVEPRRVQAA